MNDQVITSTQSPTWIAAQTAYGEARDQGEAGMHAVLNVIANRVSHPTWWGNDVVSVCLEKEQFDCWNAKDPNRAVIEAATIDDPIFAQAFVLADAMVAGRLADITSGADSYYATYIGTPDWVATARFTCQVGSQRFYVTRERG